MRSSREVKRLRGVGVQQLPQLGRERFHVVFDRVLDVEVESVDNSRAKGPRRAAVALRRTEHGPNFPGGRRRGRRRAEAALSVRRPEQGHHDGLFVSLLALDDVGLNLGAAEQAGCLREGGTVVAHIGQVQAGIGDADQEGNVDDVDVGGVLTVVGQPALANIAGILAYIMRRG